MQNLSLPKSTAMLMDKQSSQKTEPLLGLTLTHFIDLFYQVMEHLSFVLK